MLFIRSCPGIVDDLVHGFRMVKLIPSREMEWRLMDLTLLVVVPNIAGFLAGSDIRFGVRHAWSCACDISMRGAPSFSLSLVLSKMGEFAGGEKGKTYLIFLVLRGRVGIRQKPTNGLAIQQARPRGNST